MKIKKRLDVLLVERLYAETRSKAQAIIMSGNVYVNGQKADKPGTSFEETVEIEVRGAVCPYVSRGGLKLEKALRDFGVKPEGFVCYDVAVKKAYTVVALKMSTIELKPLAQPGASLYGIQFTNDGKIVIFGGGDPLKGGKGKIVGGLGVSGGSEEQDTALSAYAAARLAGFAV